MYSLDFAYNNNGRDDYKWMRYCIYTQDEYMGKIKIVVSDQQPFMIDGIIGFLGHYPDLYEVVGGYKDLKKAIAECNKSAAQIFILGE